MNAKPITTILAMLIACMTLAACGNKGSLTLPPKEGIPQQKIAAKPAQITDHNSAPPAAQQ